MNQLFFKRFILVGLFSTLLLLFSSCSSPESSKTSHGIKSSSNNSNTTLTVAYSAEPSTIDWMYNGATATRDVGWHIFETLFALDHEYNVQPMIAEDFIISDDLKVYTITIRDDVKFHDGKTVTVEDVIASIDRWLKVSSVGQITNDFIEHVKKIDEKSLEVKLNTVYNSLLDDFAAPKSALMIIPAEIAKSSGEQPLKDEDLIGTGPYELSHWDKGKEIVLTKFEDYTKRTEKDWGGLTGEKIAHFEEIKFEIVKDPQVGINGIRTGLYDYVESVSPDLFDVIETDPELEPITYINGYTTIIPNKSKEPFSDLKIRQALNYGLNKESMGEAVFGSDQFYQLDGALFEPEQKALYSNVGTDEYFVYDQEKAKQLLADSNYQGETITVMYANNYPEYEKVGEVMKQQLEEIGFNIELISYEWATYLNQWSETMDWDAVIVGWSTRFSPNELGMLGLGVSSSGYYESERWENLLKAWGIANIGEERTEILGEMNETVWAELPFIKIGNTPSLQIKSNAIKDYDRWVGPRFWNVKKDH